MIIVSWAVFTCIVLAHNIHDLASVILGLILFVAMYGIVALHNDFSDVETDRINHRKDVPYAMGLLTQKQLIITIVTLSAITTIAGYILNYSVLLWVSLYITLGYAYSGPLNVKSRGILAALLLGFCYGAMPWLIGASATNQLDHYNLLFLAFASFIFSSGIIVIKDFKDVKGDRATGKKTLLVSKGPSFTRYYYLSVTSFSYVLLVVFSRIFNLNVSFVFTGIAFGLLNYWLLMPQFLLSKAISRSTRGKWSRVIFFSYAVLLYFIT
ncbi:MAG TPA: UbiA family prenyltransferase [Candidatus Microsaccharimonas sp.]